MLQGLFGRHAILPAEQHLLGALGIDVPWQQQRHDTATEAQLGFAKQAARVADRHVTGQRDLEAAGQHVTVDCGHGGLGGMPETHDQFEIGIDGRAPFGLGAAIGRQPCLQIETRAEGAAVTVNHDCMDRIVGFDLIQRAVDLGNHRRIDRVELVGSIQTEQGNRALVTQLDGFERHAISGHSRMQRL